MSKELSPRKIELLEIIIDYPYDTSQVTYAEVMGVSRSRINHMIRDLRKFGKEEILSFA